MHLPYNSTTGASAKPPGSGEDNLIRWFDVNVPEEQLTDLRERIAPTRWPEKALIARVFDGKSEGLTRDDVLDNIPLYWLTNTTISSVRLYWENKLNSATSL
jgi:hypothetical protein